LTTSPPPQPLQPTFLPPGTQVGDFKVIRISGLGTFGTVYLAHKVGEKESLAALKVARIVADPRFKREAELLARTPHPSIPGLLAYGEWDHPDGPFPFLAMEWVDGAPLYTATRGLGMSSRQVARWVGQVASALATVHAADGFHRDVKGGNILVRFRDSRAILIDFGAGDYLGAETLTQGVLPPGTYPYRSPEALRFQWRFWRAHHMRYQPGAADDVYSLGVTAWRLVTGIYPPRDEPSSADSKPPGRRARVHRLQVPLESLAAVHPELARWVYRMLSDEPSSRPRAVEVAQACERLVETGGPEADRPFTPVPALSSALIQAWRIRERSRPRRLLQTWGPYVGAGAAMSASVLIIHSVWSAWPYHIRWPSSTGAQEQRDGGVEDAGTSGLGEGATAVSVSVQGPQLSGHALRAQVPKQPLPSQARRPCQKDEVEINGGCWVLPPDALPPCAARSYEWQGLCYHPVIAPTPPSTSEDP
jgi:serine/threonine protein kinase